MNRRSFLTTAATVLTPVVAFFMVAPEVSAQAGGGDFAFVNSPIATPRLREEESIEVATIDANKTVRIAEMIQALLDARKNSNIINSPFDISGNYGLNSGDFFTLVDYYWSPYWTPGTTTVQPLSSKKQSGVEFYYWNPGMVSGTMEVSSSALTNENWVHLNVADKTGVVAENTLWSAPGGVMVVEHTSGTTKLNFNNGENIYLSGLISGYAKSDANYDLDKKIDLTFGTVSADSMYTLVLEKAEADKALPEIWVDMMISGSLTIEGARRIVVNDNVRFNKSVNKVTTTTGAKPTLTIKSPFSDGKGKMLYFEFANLNLNSANPDYEGDWTFGYRSSVVFNLNSEDLKSSAAFGTGRIFLRSTSLTFGGDATELANGDAYEQLINRLVFDGDGGNNNNTNLPGRCIKIYEAKRDVAEVGKTVYRVISGGFENGNRGSNNTSFSEHGGTTNFFWGVRQDDTYKNETWVITGDNSLFSGDYLLGGSDYDTEKYGVRAQIIFGEGRDFVGENYNSIVGSSMHNINAMLTDTELSEINGSKYINGSDSYESDTIKMAAVGFDYSNRISIANKLTGSLRVYQFSSGTLNLTNTSNDFTKGIWVLEGGTLEIQNFAALGRTTLNTYGGQTSEGTAAVGNVYGSVNLVDGSLLYTGTGTTTNKVYLGEILSTGVTLSDGRVDSRYSNGKFEINIANAETTVYWDATTYSGTYDAEKGAQSVVGVSGAFAGSYDSAGYDPGARTGDFIKSGTGTLVVTGGHILNPIDDGSNKTYNIILRDGNLRFEGAALDAAFYKDGTHSLGAIDFCGGSLSFSENSVLGTFSNREIILRAMTAANGYEGYDETYTHKMCAENSDAGITEYYSGTTFTFEVSGTGNIEDIVNPNGSINTNMQTVTALEIGRDVSFAGATETNTVHLEMVQQAILNEAVYLLIKSSTAMNETKTTQTAIAGIETDENGFITNIQLSGTTFADSTRQDLHLVLGGTTVIKGDGTSYTIGGSAADIYLWVTPLPLILTLGNEGTSVWTLGARTGPADGAWYGYLDDESVTPPLNRNQVRGQADKFLNNDVVFFSDSSVDVATSQIISDRTIEIKGDVRPAQIVVNAENKNYIWKEHADGGSITGTATVTKTGKGTLSIELANTYSGGTIIRDGEVYAKVAGALGTGSVTVENTGKLFVHAQDALGSGNITVNSSGYVEVTHSNAGITGTVNITGTPGVPVAEDSRFYAWAENALGNASVNVTGGMVVGREQNAFTANKIVISGLFNEDGSVKTAGTLYASSGEDKSHWGAFGNSNIEIIGPGRFFADTKISSAEGSATAGTLKISSANNDYTGIVYIGADGVFDNLTSVAFNGGVVAYVGDANQQSVVYDISNFKNWEREGLNNAKFYVAPEDATLIASASGLVANKSDTLEKYGDGVLKLNSNANSEMPGFRGKIFFMTTEADSEFGASNGGKIILNFVSNNAANYMSSEHISGTGILRFEGHSATVDVSGVGHDTSEFAGTYEFALNTGELLVLETLIRSPEELANESLTTHFNTQFISGNVVLDTTNGGQYRYFGNVLTDTSEMAKAVEISHHSDEDALTTMVITQTSAGTLAAKIVKTGEASVNLLKYGVADLTLIGDSTSLGDLHVFEGKVFIGSNESGNAGSWVGAIQVEAGTELVYNHATGTSVNILSSYSGAGTIRVQGAETVNYSGGSENFDGSLEVASGTFANAGTLRIAKDSYVAAGASFANTGTLNVAAKITNAGTIDFSAGTVSLAGVLSSAVDENSKIFHNTGTVNITAGTLGSGSIFSLTGTTAPAAVGDAVSYTLVKGGAINNWGTLTESNFLFDGETASNLNLRLSVANDGVVNLIKTDASGATSLYWNLQAGGTWDESSANWRGGDVAGAVGTGFKFKAGDDVSFNDNYFADDETSASSRVAGTISGDAVAGAITLDTTSTLNFTGTITAREVSHLGTGTAEFKNLNVEETVSSGIDSGWLIVSGTLQAGMASGEASIAGTSLAAANLRAEGALVFSNGLAKIGYVDTQTVATVEINTLAPSSVTIGGGYLITQSAIVKTGTDDVPAITISGSATVTIASKTNVWGAGSSASIDAAAQKADTIMKIEKAFQLTAGNAVAWSDITGCARPWVEQGDAVFIHQIAGVWNYNNIQYIGAYYSDGFIYLARIPEPSFFGVFVGFGALAFTAMRRRKVQATTRQKR